MQTLWASICWEQPHEPLCPGSQSPGILNREPIERTAIRDLVAIVRSLEKNAKAMHYALYRTIRGRRSRFGTLISDGPPCWCGAAGRWGVTRPHDHWCFSAARAFRALRSHQEGVDEEEKP